jgi:hypothetical protein
MQFMAALEAAKACRVGEKEGSIEAKVAMSIAKLHIKMKDPAAALVYASMAVHVFRHTCGEDSPLLASALKIRGEVQVALPGLLPQAVDSFINAFKIEAQKDLVELMTMMELVQLIQAVCRFARARRSRPICFLPAYQCLHPTCLQDAANARSRRPPPERSMRHRHCSVSTRAITHAGLLLLAAACCCLLLLATACCCLLLLAAAAVRCPTAAAGARKASA